MLPLEATVLTDEEKFADLFFSTLQEDQFWSKDDTNATFSWVLPYPRTKIRFRLICITTRYPSVSIVSRRSQYDLLKNYGY